MIKTNMTKARAIAHGHRRLKRDEDMKPLDIQATIPANAAKAESDRQVIRDKNASTQLKIDGAANEAELKNIMVTDGLMPTG